MPSKILRVFLPFLLVTALVVSGSFLSVSLWGSKPEKIETSEIKIDSPDLTILQIAERNRLPLNPVLKAAGIDSAAASTKSVAQLDLSSEQFKTKIEKSLVLYSEEQSKNWLKIFLKFLLWFAILPIPFILLFKKKLSPKKRLLLTGAGAAVFGIVFGSDPSPMGTVKDALFLLTAHGTVFVPRIIALAVFLATVVIANKFICSWGCQFGLLQEFLFRINRNRKDRKGIIRQIKVPFVVSNSIRMITFVGLIAGGLLWGFDIIEPVDPFKIFHPSVLLRTGIAFIAAILIMSLFIYRPWCHFFCPFGLVSWLFEKLAIFRIKVDYDKCIACMACSKNCPSNVMDTILKKGRIKPDCFSCGTCIESCPTDAVSFTLSREDTGGFQDALVNKQKRREKNQDLHEED